MKSNKSTILIFIDWFEPGYRAGGPIRSISNLCAHLKDDFNFLIVTSDTDYTLNQPYDSIQPNVWITKKDHLKVMYLSGKITFSRIKSIINSISFDRVYLNSLYSKHFSLFPILAIKDKSKITLAPRGMLSEGSMQVKSKKKNLFIGLFKLLGFNKKITFHSTSTDETERLKTILNADRILEVSNFPIEIPDLRHVTLGKSTLKLIYIGRIAPEKNTLFAIKALIDIKEPTILDIYGPIYNLEYQKSCCAEIKKLPKHLQVTFKKERTPNELTELLPNYHFLISPTSGENFGHAIFESLALGTPCLISNKTPWRNLQKNECGFDLPLQPEIWRDKMSEIHSIISKDSYRELRENAHQYASKQINIISLKELYLQLFA